MRFLSIKADIVVTTGTGSGKDRMFPATTFGGIGTRFCVRGRSAQNPPPDRKWWDR